MRTKTLLLTAALSAAGVATSMAQGAVYSVNAVGYVNVTLQADSFNLVANPLDAADNSIPALFAGLPSNTTIYKFDPEGGYTSWLLLPNGNWAGSPAASGVTVEPGEAVFIRLPAGSDVTHTFVGEVPQGSLSQPIPTGLSLQSSQVPQAGLITTDLGFPAQANDTLFQFDPEAGYTSKLYNAGQWLGGEPQIDVAEGFFIRRAGAAGNWTRNFSVNDQ